MPNQIEEALKTIETSVSDFRNDYDKKLTNSIETATADNKVVSDKLETTTAEVTANLESITKTLADQAANIESVKDLASVVTAKPKHTDEEKLHEMLGHFAYSLMGGEGKPGAMRSAKWLHDQGYLDMQEGTTGAGGALVFPEFAREVINLQNVYGAFRRNARVVPLGSDSKTWPKIDSGVTTYYPDEGATITASDIGLSQVELIPRKVAALTVISNELGEDAAMDVGAIIADEMIRGIGQAEDQAGFLGDGTSTYGKFVGLPGAFTAIPSYTNPGTGVIAGSVVGASGNLWTEITWADFQDMIGTLPSNFQANAKWYCHPLFYYNIMLPVAFAESSTLATIGLATEMAAGIPQMFMGKPVELIDVMPSTTAVSQFSCYYGDLKRGIYLGDRKAMRIEQSTEAYFTTDQRGVRGIERIAINVFGVGTTTVAGPIVGLITNAS